MKVDSQPLSGGMMYLPLIPRFLQVLSEKGALLYDWRNFSGEVNACPHDRYRNAI